MHLGHGATRGDNREPRLSHERAETWSGTVAGLKKTIGLAGQPAGAIRQSFSKLCEAQIKRHSLLAASRPRRTKRR